MGFLFVVMAIGILQKKRRLARGRLALACTRAVNLCPSLMPKRRRRGHARTDPRSLAFAASWLALLLLPGALSAAGATPPEGAKASDAAHPTRANLGVVFRTVGAADWQLSTRIRGQTSDLPLTITEIPTPFLEERLRDQLRAAEALGTQTRAGVVLWRTPRSLFAFITTPAPGYVVERKLDDGGDAAGSAALEQVAVAARTLLRAVAEGVLIGQPRDAVLAREETPPPPTSSAGPAWRLALEAHLTIQGDGLGPAWGYGGAVGVRRAAGLALLGADWSATRSRDTLGGAGHFKRYAFYAQASPRLWARDQVELRAVARVQMVIWQIGLFDSSTGLEDRVNRFRPVLTPGLDAALFFLGDALALHVEIALDVLPDPPALRVVRNGMEVQSVAPHVLEPRAALGLMATWR